MARTSAVSSSTRAEPMTVSTFVAPDDLDAVTELLRAQLEGLPARSSLYAEHFAEHGVTPAAFSSLEDLRKFPFTTKQMLRDSQAAAPPLGRHAGLPIRDALERIGSTLVPIGTGASAKAVLALETLGVTALHSTPSYARYLAEYVRRMGRDPREFGLSKIFVG